MRFQLRDGDHLRLAGQIDLTNRAIWRAIIDSPIPAPEPLSADTVGITFIDAARVRQLNRLIAQRPAGQTRILCGPITATAACYVAGAQPSMCFGSTELDAA